MPLPPNTRLRRTRRPSLREGGSLRSLGEPLKRIPSGGRGRCSALAALVIGSVLLTSLSCASQSPPGFGVVDEYSPLLKPTLLSGVNKNMTLGDVFRVLGPAHWVPCTDNLCYGWLFTDGRLLTWMLTVYPEGATPGSALERFELVQLQ